MGIPGDDRNRFRTWSNTVVSPALTPESLEEFAAQMKQFVDYLRELFARRRAEPGPDLISALLQAEDGGETLSEHELSSMVVLLIVAGHETTVSLIGNGTLVLLEHPDQLELLRTNPDLIGTAVEELLRFEGPVERALTRWATTDVEVDGHTIRRGEAVIAIIGSANRDEGRFERPDTLDLTRQDSKHIAFGRGSHYCLGAPLARLEGEIALATLFRRLPGLRLNVAHEELVWRPVPLFRSLGALPVAWR
jgi:cytochrome P450